MLANKNNLKSELTANVGVLDTTISITSGEGILRENNMVACLEHYENDVCTKREIVKITAKSTDTFTVTRGFAVCIMNDATKQQGQGSQTFSVGDFLSLYLSKELWESITQNIGINETALQTMVGHITAPRTCINDNCLSWKQSIDSAYNSKYGGIAGFGDASDGDCVITTNDLDDHGYFYFDASREYNFNNLTICDGVVVRFLGTGVPKINVRNNFINCGEIELKSGFVSNTNLTDCRLEQGCQICNNCTDWGLCQGGRGGCGGGNGSPGCSGCPGSGDVGGTGGMGGQGCPGCPAVGCNGGTGGRGRSANNCNGGGGGGGGGGAGLYGNGGDGGRGGYNGASQTHGGEGGKGGNSGLFGRAGNGGEEGSAYYGNGGKGGDGGDGRIGGNGYGVSDRTSDTPGVGGKGVLCGGNGGGADGYKDGGVGGDAITNVYGFHLNARNIWNKCVNARGGNGGNGGCVECGRSGNGGNGANGGQMIISYDCIHEQGCFDVRGGCGGCPGHVRRPSCGGTSGSYGSAGSDGRVIFRTINNPYITNFNLENDSDNESILISWKDPTLKQSAPNPRKKTIVRVSTVNFPTTITDGTLVVEETTKNQYETTPFSMSATDGVTYYFTAFAIAQDDTMIDVQTNSITAEFGWGNLDISTATLSKQFTTGYGFQGLYINPDENVALTAQYNGTSAGTIRGYTYSNKDISTATLEGTKSPVRYIHCVFANKDGTHIYFGTHSDNTIYEYTTTNRNVSNMTSYKSINIGATVQCLWIDDTETYVVVAGTGSSGHGISLYQMSTPGDISTITLIKTATMGFNIHGIFFDKQMKKCVMCEYSSSSGTVRQYDRDILNENTPTQTHILGPVGFTIGYANITNNGKKMYVSRENGYIYEYSLG